MKKWGIGTSLISQRLYYYKRMTASKDTINGLEILLKKA